jgi:hypothetical protein
MLKKVAVLTCPAQAREDAPLRRQGRNKVREATKKEPQVADGREPVSFQYPRRQGILYPYVEPTRCENAVGGLFQHPARAILIEF